MINDNDSFYDGNDDTLFMMEFEVCQHLWQNRLGLDYVPCVYCKKFLVKYLRFKCQYCHLEACKFCLKIDSNTPDTNTSCFSYPYERKRYDSSREHLVIEVEKLQLEIDKLTHLIEKMK